MAQQNPKTYRLRFPLFIKIIGSIGAIIMILVSFSIVILLQLKPLFTSDNQYEFQSIHLTQYLDKLFDAENQSAINSLTTKDLRDRQTLVLITGRFHSATDSLLQMTERRDIRSLIQDMADQHNRYEGFLRRQEELSQHDPSYDATSALQEEQPVVDSLRATLHIINYANLPGLDKAIKGFEQRTSIAMTGAYISFVLSFVLAIAAAIILARTLTKPIQALKAGTEKVGEGIFETVPISTSDEVADLTRAFNLMSDKLKQLDEMRMQLMSEISHEMRTPLQVIKAGCYSIVHTKDGPPLTERQRNAIGMITQSTNRINSFVNSFLDVAKMEAGLMKFNFEEINIVELLTPLVQEAQLIGQTRQINIEFVAEEVPPIQLDKERMSQVCSNLLSNALKYTPDDGKISVRVTKMHDCNGTNKNNRGCVRVEVQDSGVGIPEGDLKKLFNKFYQAQNTPLVNEKGSGLGLALVKHVAEAHGGRVSVQSQVGVGSTFSVFLPA